MLQIKGLSVESETPINTKLELAQAMKPLHRAVCWFKVLISGWGLENVRPTMGER
jgi:hypothetical protein